MPARIARAMAWVLCVASSCASGMASAQSKSPVSFLNAGAGDASVTQSVGAATDVYLPFTLADKRKLEFYLSPLAGEHGDGVTLQPSILEMPAAKASGGRLAFAAEPGVLTLRLQGPPLANAGKYTGNLAVLEDGKPVQTLRLAIQRAPTPRPAKVVVEPKSLAVYQRVGGWSSPGAFSFQVRNIGSDWPAEGVFLRLLEATPPAGANFDPTRNLRLSWNRQAGEDLWRSPAPGSGVRSIAPHQQAEVNGELRGLAAGEYTLKIGFGMANAPADADQQLSMKLYVKHRWGWALLVLMLAMIISYIATKFVESQRRRVGYLAKVAEIRPPWLRDEPAVLPAVAARSILTQVEDRNQDTWSALFGQDVSKAHVEKAERLIRIVERLRQTSQGAKGKPWDRMVTHRFNKRLSSTIGALEPHGLTEERTKQMETDLAALEQWFDDSRRDELHWKSLKVDMEALIAQINTAVFDANHRAVVDALHAAVEAGLKAQLGGRALYQLEEQYAKLKIFWERQQKNDVDAVRVLHAALKNKPAMSIDEFFALADGLAWERLKHAELEFTAPVHNDVDPPRAYELVRFEIAPKNDPAGAYYHFKHGIEYTWSIEFDKGETGNRKRLNTRRTREPRLVHYCPAPGRLYVRVSLRYGGEILEKEAKDSWKIGDSSEYGWMSLFRLNEMLALGIAFGLAAVSGMATFYFKNPVFGAIGDYLALFIWGAGVDQTKNLIQNIDRKG